MKIENNKFYQLDKDLLLDQRLEDTGILYKLKKNIGFDTIIKGSSLVRSFMYSNTYIFMSILLPLSYLKEVKKDKTSQSSNNRIKSNGGESDYYKVVLPSWLLDKQRDKGYIMLEDLAEILYKNDFNYTNNFKAQCRMFALESGTGKEGNTFEYDANKCKYYIDKQVEVFNRANN